MTMQRIDGAHDVLKRVWGYDSFRPLQKESVQCVLDRRDSLTVLPTGGGKSICFQVPALCMDGLAVVVSPLISLMKDQVDALRSCGVAAAFINSTQGPNEKRAVADQIRSGELKLLYVAPERLLAPRTLDFLAEQNVSFVAIDEAHCISNWGHDFRPEYRGLRILKQRFPGIAVHAMTATASEPVRRDIATQLGLQQPEFLVGSFDRPNLSYRMLRSNNRMQQIVDVIERHRNESGIVYCISRKEVERTSLCLNQLGVTSLPYHAGMSDGDREANQEAFIQERCDVIVATVAFGMGIDKSNVRFVIHAGMPKSIEHYQQESGRAGRDGLESECVLIYSGGDVVTWKKIMSGEPQSYEAAAKSLDAMFDLCSAPSCRHKAIVEYFGQQYESDNCRACDVCLDEIDLVDDPIVLGQKILSCVVRLKERFGAAHTAKVLVGSGDKRVLELGHDSLSTYGLLTDAGQQAVRTWIEQLIGQGYLQRTGEYQTLSLTDSGWQLIKGQVKPQLTVADAPRSRSRSQPSVDSWDGVDRDLFEALRQLRSTMAAKSNVPAYIVFGDATLRELARVRPSSPNAFGQIKGVGERKLADFGEAFVEAIAKHCEKNGLAMDVHTIPSSTPMVRTMPAVPKPNAVAAFPLFRQGETVEAVAQKLGRAVSTVAGYLQDYIRSEKITDPTQWVDPKTAALVEENISAEDEGRLRPLFDRLEGNVDFETLRIVLTCHEVRLQMATDE
ncbi:DNA helicase RecQ [Stieleria varia]|uniref:DNA helicase RecQ n=1 Tax=Stieleria varia TaxID=2528005 RepID=A0A5C6B9D5_9BACT|nr:DNA helicase RecQ [Stieleria varia]TWU08252.1 ATP-dependent DNA helicase RecQ [Stieleria varia]